MIPEYLVRLGPFFAPAIFALLSIAALVAARLIVTGIRQRRIWRIGIGGGIASYVAAVVISELLS